MGFMRRLPASLLALCLIAAGCSDTETSNSVPPTSNSVPPTTNSVPPTTNSFPLPTITVHPDGDDVVVYEVPQRTGCFAEPGSPSDLLSEPTDWLLWGDYHRWFDSEGCPVRLDVIAHIHGSGHCDLEKAEFITLGLPLTQLFDVYSEGTYISSRYIWAPDGIIRGVASGEEIPRFAVPESAIDTEYRQDEAELWVDPTDPTVIFLIRDEQARVFRLNPTAGMCA